MRKIIGDDFQDLNCGLISEVNSCLYSKYYLWFCINLILEVLPENVVRIDPLHLTQFSHQS